MLEGDPVLYQRGDGILDCGQRWGEVVAGGAVGNVEDDGGHGGGLWEGECLAAVLEETTEKILGSAEDEVAVCIEDETVHGGERQVWGRASGFKVGPEHRWDG